jgi:hypothetical protein
LAKFHSLIPRTLQRGYFSRPEPQKSLAHVHAG